MNSLITTSGYTLTPPSGLMIVSHSIQLSSASGTVVVSGSLGTMNAVFAADELVPFETHFLMQENVTITPTNATAVFNYVYAGSPEMGWYYDSVVAYSNASGIQKWTTPVMSGSFNYGSGKFGG